MLGGGCGVFIHRALHGRIGGKRSRLALNSSMTDCVRVLQGVGEPVCHLLRQLVHHTLCAVEVAWPLLGMTLTLVLPLGLCNLYLPRLWLLQHCLASSGGHHLECDNGRQLLPAHGDIHGSEHRPLAVVLTHARVRTPHLVWYKAKHMASIAVLGHAHPALLLSQHVADRGQHWSGGGAAQEGRGVCSGGDCSGHIACVRVW